VHALLELGKPRLSALVMVTTAGGSWLAPGRIGAVRGLVTLLMTTAAVAAANTLNCFLERTTDARMKRTRTRPLDTGALSPSVALAYGLTLATVSVAALALFVNGLAAALAGLAIVSYVALYTPMKFRSPHAVIVGALPGAIPPLLGWSAVTGRIDPGGMALFALMFVWQLPHFLAIALYLREDYGRAGIRVLPLTHGDAATRVCLSLYALVFVPVSLSLTRLHVAGTAYLVVAGVSGLAYFAWSLTGFKAGAGTRWARGMMLGSIVHLSLLFVVLALDTVRSGP
jgi:protoheme IX farnesyltransferase